MFLAAAIQQHRPQYLTFLLVGTSHLLALYLIWQSTAELAIAVPSRENAIQVRFVNLKQTQTLQQSAATQQLSISREQQQQDQSQAQAATNTNVKTKRAPIIHATSSTKTVAATKTDTQSVDQSAQKMTKAMQQTQSKQQTSEQRQHQQQQSKQQQSDTSSHLATNTAGTQNKSQEASSDRQSKDSQQEQNTAAVEQNAAPIRVNRVDILSLAKFSYDDRELQNQQRLILLSLQINAQGQLISIQVKQSSGIASLDERAMKAMYKSKFKPHKVNGEAVAIVVDFPFQLKLGRNR